MANHFRKECEHGTLVSQCRCAAPNKTVILVPCPPHCKGAAKLNLSAPPFAPEPVSADHEALVALIKRISPIKQEPLATAVAEEWAAEFEKDGWVRGGPDYEYGVRQEGVNPIFTLNMANNAQIHNRREPYPTFEAWLERYPIKENEVIVRRILPDGAWEPLT